MAGVAGLLLLVTALPSLAGSAAPSAGDSGPAITSWGEGTSPTATTATTTRPASPSSAADLAFGAGPAGPNPIDLLGKGLIVAGLLYVTLRVLRRVQAGPTGPASRLAVLESRTLATKASLHLVAVGDRRLVIGLTPGGMVALAELDAAEIGAIEPRAIEPRAIEASEAPAVSGLPAAFADLLKAFRGAGERA